MILAEKDGISRTAIVANTGVNRSTVAAMARQIAKRGLVAHRRGHSKCRKG